MMCIIWQYVHVEYSAAYRCVGVFDIIYQIKRTRSLAPPQKENTNNKIKTTSITTTKIIDKNNI